MAYLLRFDGVDAYVGFPILGTATNITITIDFEYKSITTGSGDLVNPVIGSAQSNDNGDDFFYLGADTAGNWYLQCSKTFSNFQLTTTEPVTINTPYIVDLVYNGSVWSLTVNGTNLGSTPDAKTEPLTYTNGLSRIGAAGIQRANVDFRDMEVSGDVSRLYDANASGGTGTVLPETTSNQDGTLFNFTTDYWVSYAAEGTPTLTLTNPPQLGAVLSGTGSNYAAQPTGPISITQGARSLPDMPITVSAWDAGAGSFNWTTNAALPGFPANGADATPFVLTGEDVTITLPDPGV